MDKHFSTTLFKFEKIYEPINLEHNMIRGTLVHSVSKNKAVTP